MNSLKVGATKLDLDPPVGIWLTGYGGRIEPSQGKHDPIMARAIAVSDGQKTCLLVSADLIGFDVDDAMQMRKDIEAKTGVPVNSIIISCTHTHSGPASMPLRGNMGILDKPWNRTAREKIVDLADKAVKKLAPAVMVYATKDLKEIGYNRQPGGGPVDEKLRVLRFESPTGEPIATLVNYAMHAVVLGPSNLLLSADFPGEVCKQIEKKGGIAVYLQGCSGDIDPAINKDRWGKGTFEDTAQIGSLFAKAVETALKGAEKKATARVSSCSEVAKMPLKPPPPPDELTKVFNGLKADFDAAKSFEAKVCAKAMLEWKTALQNALQSGGPPDVLNAEVTSIMIGDVRIVGLPFECYTEIGLEIAKGLSPLKPMVAGYSNGLYGYCATDAARARGGYGPDSSHRWFPRLLTPLDNGSSKALIDTAIHTAWNT